jgi:LAO/AO transport system kinase
VLSNVDIVKKIFYRDRYALSKAISIIENREDGYLDILKDIYKNTGKSHVIGITGPPGVGKSTLIAELAQEFVSQGKYVGIIAIDPTSPFSGGAILGDRIRMNDLELNKNVFIRSMATRGGIGGIATTTRNIIRLMEGFQMDVIIVETVGTGQADVDIINVAETVAVVLSPNLGDDIQTLKAGMLEIGDIFIINKIDIEGADEAIAYLENMISIAKYPYKEWMPVVIGTSALKKMGIKELVDAIYQHKKNLSASKGIPKRNERVLQYEMEGIIYDEFMNRMRYMMEHDPETKELMTEVYNKNIDPYTASQKILEKVIDKNKFNGK